MTGLLRQFYLWVSRVIVPDPDVDAALAETRSPTESAMRGELKTIEFLVSTLLFCMMLIIAIYAITVSPDSGGVMSGSLARRNAEASTAGLLATTRSTTNDPATQSPSSSPAASGSASNTVSGSDQAPTAAEPAPDGTAPKPLPLNGSQDRSDEQGPTVADLHRPGFVFTFSILSALLIGSFVSGGFFGFLFGIPREIQATTSAGAGDDKRNARFVGNTNLDVISDWLTKIIVGLGLTQASNLYAAFMDGRKAFLTGSMASAAGADILFIAVVLSGIVIGFLFFYMETRTRITLLLVTSDQVQTRYADTNVLAKAAKTSDTEEQLRSVRVTSALDSRSPPAPTAQDRKIALLPIDAARDTSELITWVMSQIKVQNFPEAERALNRALREDPDNVELMTALAAVKNWAGEPMAANEILSRALVQFPESSAVWRDKLLASLYLKPPQSYLDAFAAARELKARDKSAEGDPFVSLWVACANGQKYAYVSDEGSKAEARAAALQAIKDVINNSSPGSLVRKTLRDVFDPAGSKAASPGDNDLEVFKGYQDFVDVVRTAI